MAKHIHIPFLITILWMHLKELMPKISSLFKNSEVKRKIEDFLKNKLEMKQKSRKLFLLYVVVILATVGTFVPPTVTWILQLMHKQVVPFEILGSTEWVSMISLVVTTYFGSNVWEKHVALSNGISPNELDNTCMAIKGSPGAQNVNANVAKQQSQQDADIETLKDKLKHGQD